LGVSVADEDDAEVKEEKKLEDDKKRSEGTGKDERITNSSLVHILKYEMKHLSLK
jgi:hypothetical protein